MDAAFSPLEAILLQVERDGTLEVSDSGTLAYFMAAHGKTYEVVSLLDGYAAIFDVARSHDAKCPDSEPLARAAAQLAAHEIGQRDIADARRCLAELRAYVATLSTQAISALVTTAEIKFRLEALDKAAQPAP
ncbi:hypothetical protein ACS7SF_17220 [Ralstonia sp. 25C]|uniref:hypothetical protein n=1 Tax=Ralstonia sp. 25C TaxID=3447363 RepID=UPI003F7559ED